MSERGGAVDEDDIEGMLDGIGNALNVTSRIMAFGPVDDNWHKVAVIDNALKAAYGMLHYIEPSKKKELS